MKLLGRQNYWEECVSITTPEELERMRAVGAIVTGGYLILVLLNLTYLYPVLTAEIIPFSAWTSRMWFHRWI